MQKKSKFNSVKDVKKRLSKLHKEFQDYQLSLYAFLYSSFLETMLLENFDSEYLNSIAWKIEDYDYQYGALYTKCYDQIEVYLSGSLQSHLISGLASINRVAGNVIAKVPVINKTQVDENLIKASRKLGDLKYRKTAETMAHFQTSQSGYVRPFAESINIVNKLFNQPMELIFDQENVYFNLSDN